MYSSNWICSKWKRNKSIEKIYIQLPIAAVLQQHFIGWFIKTKVDTFDDTTATFMDFSVPQKGNTRFMYVLPMDKQTALFEYTLFSKERLLLYADPINIYSQQYLYHCMPPVLYCYRNIDAVISISFRLTTFSAESWLPYSVQSEKYI